MNVTPSVFLTGVAYLVQREHKFPVFLERVALCHPFFLRIVQLLGLIALATGPADAYEDSRAKPL